MDRPGTRPAPTTVNYRRAEPTSTWSQKATAGESTRIVIVARRNDVGDRGRRQRHGQTQRDPLRPRKVLTAQMSKSESGACDGFQVEDLGRYVPLGIGAAHEAADRAPRQAL